MPGHRGAPERGGGVARAEALDPAEGLRRGDHQWVADLVEEHVVTVLAQGEVGIAGQQLPRPRDRHHDCGAWGRGVREKAVTATAILPDCQIVKLFRADV